jgi:hypothetical protein
VIEAIHTAYLEGGADIIETNTFNGTRASQVGGGSLRVLACLGQQQHMPQLL